MLLKNQFAARFASRSRPVS
uniref:Uncharacterized protein n=1 Tax=Anguilla anguilla TaxID=7936 RepID=A0A0E9V5P0_ANGAN